MVSELKNMYCCKNYTCYYILPLVRSCLLHFDRYFSHFYLDFFNNLFTGNSFKTSTILKLITFFLFLAVSVYFNNFNLNKKKKHGMHYIFPNVLCIKISYFKYKSFDNFNNVFRKMDIPRNVFHNEFTSFIQAKHSLKKAILQ